MRRFISLMGWMALFAPSDAYTKDTSPQSSIEFLIYENTMPSLARIDPDTGQFKGLYADLMKGASDYTGIVITLRFEGRQRAEQAVYDGTSDAIMMHPTWAKQIHRLKFSDPVFEHKEYLYSIHEIDQSVKIQTLVENAEICVHQGYQYPTLTPFFESGLALSSEVSSHSELLTLLVNGRCDFAIMSPFRAKWAAKKLRVDQSLYRIETPITESELGIAVRAEREDFLIGFNAYIAEIKRTGEWERMQMNQME